MNRYGASGLYRKTAPPAVGYGQTAAYEDGGPVEALAEHAHRRLDAMEQRQPEQGTMSFL